MNKETKPEAKQPEHAHAASDEMTQLIQMVKDYLVPIGAGVVIALVLIVGFGLVKSNRSAKAEKAAAALMQAGSLEDIQRVAKEYKNTPTGPAALLGLANSYLQSGQIMMARTTYDQFMNDYPKHILKPSAELGKAYCLETEGDLNGALAAYETFVTTYPDYFLVPQAILSQGRCLEQLGQFDEAKIIYENFIVEYPESRWIPHAKTAVLYAEKAKRAKEKGIEPEPAQPLFSGMTSPGFGTVPAVEAEVIEVAPATEAAAPVVQEDVVEVIAEEPTAEAPEAAIEQSVVVTEPANPKKDTEENTPEAP
ncbi:MAG: tetratricopeptide repeat protein [Kiritimatiellae bacterium]|nr:tetratricopeptide repeat protein [Kiritimatiellia bacterium]